MRDILQANTILQGGVDFNFGDKLGLFGILIVKPDVDLTSTVSVVMADGTKTLKVWEILGGFPRVTEISGGTVNVGDLSVIVG